MNDATEKDLWIRFKEQGDSAARDDLIMHYMRVVRYIAGRMAIHVPSSVEMDDLVSWGIMGLLDALEKFDHTQEIKFSTYASIRIRGAIIDQIRSLDWAPRSLRAMARKVGAAKEKLRHERGHEPSYQDIAEELGTTEEHVEGTYAQLQTAQILSLDDYLPSEDEPQESRKKDLTTNVMAPSPSKIAELRERRDRLVKAILQLPDQQQKVLNLYYYEELTLKEIGLVLEVSESRICQIHSAAMKRLRKVVNQEEG
ncbi:MAG TPA: FliA/WhiG family RNA polymerase sigma factor [Candidatus Hydrogenedentes bacterium]|nr:FliA/WhiG family RNA polymerase sigma factor [Candidatus Hydrogenedentota bacterium]